MTLTRLRAAILAALFALSWPALADIKDWSTTPGSNATITDGTYGNIGFAEGQAPSTLNDSARALMAHVRAWYQGGGWTNLGYTHTYASSTSVTVSGTDVTAQYPAGRRVRAVGATTGTIYGRVTSSSFSTNTTINFAWDSGSLSSETLAISVSFLTSTGSPAPADLSGAVNTAKGTAIASATTTDIWAATGNFVHITGTTTITGFGTAPQAGAWRMVVFDGALTLTHGASAIVLPGSASITTAANDMALVFADTTTKHLVAYFKADGTAVVSPTAYTPNRQVFTSSGSFAKSSVTNGAAHVDAWCVGAGGGGGGGNTTGASEIRGAGGGGGAYSRERIAVASLASSETVTVGTGGAGGASGAPGGAGSNGGDSTFGTTPFFTAGGGVGAAFASAASPIGGAGGAASGGDINIAGQTGGLGSPAAGSPTIGWLGFGGASPFIGIGTIGNVATNGIANTGAGGTGGNHTGGSGGTGGSGLCVVEW